MVEPSVQPWKTILNLYFLSHTLITVCFLTNKIHNFNNLNLNLLKSKKIALYGNFPFLQGFSLDRGLNKPRGGCMET